MGKIQTVSTRGKGAGRANSTRFSADDLQFQVDKLFQASLSKNTKLSYDTGLTAFQKFRLEHKFQNVWPPSLEHIVQFIAYLSLKEFSPATARLYVSAIGFECKSKDLDDVTRNFLVVKMLEGMKRLSVKKDTRLPITHSILCKIVQVLPSVCTNLYESPLFQAAYMLAFFGFLRVGELAISKGNSPATIINVSDINFSLDKSNMFLTIRQSKNDQYGKGVTICIEKSSSFHCPIRYMLAFLSMRPRINGPVFCHSDGSPLTRFQFSAVLNKATNAVGLHSHRYKSHSFRIGAATAAYQQGCHSDSSREAGRWKSQIYKSYIRCPIKQVCC